jgi:hypothetical protein
VQIPDIARRVWRKLGDADAAWDPYTRAPDEEFTSKMLAWLNEPVDGLAAGRPIITRLALGMRQSRSDLQEAFPDVLGRDRKQFSYWFRTRGRIEYSLDDYFFTPVKSARAGSFPRLRELSLRRIGIWFYYTVTSWLFRIGIGAYIERSLGEQRVSRVRRFFVRPSRRPTTLQGTESDARTSTSHQDRQTG